MDTQNQPTKPVIQPPSEKTTKAATKLLLMTPVVLLLVLIAFAFGAYWAVERNGGINNKPADDIGNYIKPDENLLVPIEENEKDVTVNVNDEQVEWIPIDQQKEVTPLGELLNLYVEKSGYEGDLTVNDFNVFSTKAFKIGTMKTGEYKGYSVVSQYIGDNSNMGTIKFYVLILLPEKIDGSEVPVILNKHVQYAGTSIGGIDFDPANLSEYINIPDKGFPIINKTLTLNGFGFSEKEETTINGQNVELFLQHTTDRFDSTYIDLTKKKLVDGLKQIGELKGSALYSSTEIGLLTPDPVDAFVVVLPDGRLKIYTVEVPGFNGVGSATLKKGSQNLGIYSDKKRGGCGFSNYIDIDKNISLNDLILFGEINVATIDSGYGEDRISTEKITVYEPKDWNADYVQETFALWNSYDPEVNTFDIFKSKNPILFWQDPLGRFVKLSSDAVAPLAECGKPVIYLYPQKTTDISVKLYPAGGFTVTEPDYGTGWNVTANPDGSLVNKADGQTYPYLFWEGRGGMYSSPQNFWVVKKAEVPTFLTTTLAKIGLNKQETADFMEFWVPLMQNAPYYKIGFHGTGVMDQIAPMKLSQQPDTILRILMDYEELSQPIKENPPKLGKTLERKGFTVIEWGGVLR